MSEKELIKKVLTEYFNPRDDDHVKAVNFMINNIEQSIGIVKTLVNEGFVEYPFRKEPYCVFLAGTASIPATLTAYVIASEVFGKDLEYIVTSHEVNEGKGVFKQSHDFLNQLRKVSNFELVVVDFTNPVIGIDARKLISIIQNSRGRVIVLQGSGFVTDFIILNAGCAKVTRPYPRNGKLVFYDLLKMISI